MLIDGRLFRGYRGRGMEMGHITVKCDGERCACGGGGVPGALRLDLGAGSSLPGASGASEADGREVVRRYEAGDAAAVRALEEHWMYLSHGIASMINLLHRNGSSSGAGSPRRAPSI